MDIHIVTDASISYYSIISKHMKAMWASPEHRADRGYHPLSIERAQPLRPEPASMDDWSQSAHEKV
jgi:hypothetical protein